MGDLMRILFSTTFGHNPGDEIILAGVQNLLRHGLNLDFDPVYYNRNPDLQFGYWREPIRNPVGNYMTSPVDLSLVDKVILAGSPEFFGPPMKGLYEALRLAGPSAPPLLALGVGLGDSGAVLDNLSKDVLTTAKTITRSAETVQFLEREGIFGARSLVCPALFASMYTSDPIHDETLYIVQAPGHGWHEIRESLLHGLEPEDYLLCMHLKELQFFLSRGYKNVRYAATGGDALRIIREYPRVVSTRLHGAIGALSLGVPAFVVGCNDFRIATTTRMFNVSDIYLPIGASIREGKDYAMGMFSEEVKEYKWDQWNLWVNTLKDMW
jgi:hypothetical protein